MHLDDEILVGLSAAELEALADGMLAPTAQARLDELLAKQSKLTQEEESRLDALLKKVDQLNLLKTRAKYTLHRQHVGAAEA